MGIVFGFGVPAGAQPAQGGFSARTIAQIAALQQVKRSLSTAEAKMDSRLVIEHRRRAGVSIGGVSAGTGVEVSERGTVLLDLQARDAEAVARQVRALGGTVRHTSAKLATVRAELPIDKVEKLAERPEVDRVDLASQAETARPDPVGPPAPGTEPKQVPPVERRAAAPAATVVSEGVRAHAVDTAIARTGITGAGVKIGVLSDGVDSLVQSQQRGELPAVDVLPDQWGEGDEGTAMLEIVHDVAPGAELAFATAFRSDASFAENIRALRFQAHADIIVDDVIYYNESPFQDGIIAQAVNDVTADGALFFSSAGNQGNVADGTSGHWEGDFVSGGPAAGMDGVVHDFDPGPRVQLVDPLSQYADWRPVTLFWSDPLGASANDYDLYVLDQQGNVVGFSQNRQTGSQNPYERLRGGNGQQVAVVKYSGADRYLSLTAERMRFSPSPDGLRAFSTPGVTRGHSAAENAVSVAAAPAAGALGWDIEPGDPPNPTGPYPGTFSSATRVERFTSDGPRRIFYRPDGTPITPGNYSSSGGMVRQKPTVTAADGVSTSVPDFNPFFGTSAAAPHAAAIAGLVKSGRPTLPNSEILREITASATDILEPGRDNRSGAGIMLANVLLARTGGQAQAIAVAQQPEVQPAGDGDPYLEPGESATIRFTVRNRGDATATNLQMSVASPGISVTPANRQLGSLPPGGTTVASFTLTVPASHRAGVPLQLQTWVSFQGFWSPRTATFTVEVGQPTTFAFTGPPVQIPDADPAGASVTIPVTGIGRASRIWFSIDGTERTTEPGATTVGIDHTYVGDLVGTLTSPSGRTATLFSRTGGWGHNLSQVVFDDMAGTPFSSLRYSDAPFSGTWRSFDALVPLIADPADGNWVFTVTDLAGVDTGTIRAVSLHLVSAG